MIRFVDEESDVMFSISVGYNKDHTSKANQVTRFESLRSRYLALGPSQKMLTDALVQPLGPSRQRENVT